MINATIALTRWREHIPYVIPLTVLGAILGSVTAGVHLDMRFVSVTLANIAAVAYAFMINDIEDAPDDARDPIRSAKNVISSGKLGHTTGYFACQLTAAIALLLYLPAGKVVLSIGLATLLLSHFYSSRPLRLKAWPVTDVVSHVLMLSTLLLLAGFYTYAIRPGAAWWVIASFTFFSGYGQLYNQLRDYKLDKLAGLHNTAILIGKKKTQMLMHTSLVIAVFCLLVSIFSFLFPLWLFLVLLCAIPLSRLWANKKDSRGSEIFEATGKYQNQTIVIFNILIVVWLFQVIIVQYIL